MSNLHEVNQQDGTGEQTQQLTTIIKILAIIGGEKGGTGKRFFCRHLIGYLLRNNWGDKFVAYDADPSVDDIYQTYKDNSWIKKVEFSDNKYKIGDPVKLFENYGNTPLVILNLPSNIQKNFDNFFEAYGLFEEDIRQSVYATAYFFFISDGSYQSIKLFVEHLKRYENRNYIKTILVLNEGQNGNSDSFTYLERQPDIALAKKFIKEVNEKGIPLLILKELSPDLRFKIDAWMAEERLTFEQIATNGEKLTILNRSGFSRYLKKIDELFQQIIESPETFKYEQLSEEQKSYRNTKKLPLEREAP